MFDRVKSVWPRRGIALGVFLSIFVVTGCQSEDTVIDKYNDLLRKDPENDQYYYRRGLRYEEMNETEKALADYTKAIELAPDEATYYYNRGNVYLTRTEYQNAIENFDEAIKLNPENADYYNNKGYASNLLKDYQSAVKQFTLALAKSSPDETSKQADYYYGRAIAYYDMGQQDKAEYDYQQARELDPDYPYTLERNDSKSPPKP